MINFLFFTILSPRGSKVDQTHKFDDVLNLTSNFIINSLGYTVFTTRVSEAGKIQSFHRKNRFLVNFRGS